MTTVSRLNRVLRVLGLGGVLAVAAVLAPVPARVAAAAPADNGKPGGPKATLRNLNNSVDKLLRMKTEPGSAEEKRNKEEIKQRASDLLDYGELCKRALGEHWEKMTPKQRTDFVDTLKELIERNYVKQLRTNLDYAVNYGDEELEGEEAKVTTTIKIATKGKSTSALIEYRMLKKPPPKSWMVYDIITDELSLVRNYRSQFQRIIASSGYDGLLSRMQKKLAEERTADEKENGKTAAPGKPAATDKPAAKKG